MRILITAGPTREYLDDVRFLSNASSGRMGYALAEAAALRGHRVELVSGPVMMPPTADCRFHAVETTEEMYEACLHLFPECDGVIAAAAVCDYRPVERLSGKIRKTGAPLMLELVETPDILAELGRRKEPGQWIVGFALEADASRENALRKMETKNCDAIVLNDPAAIGSSDNSIELIDRSGETVATCQGDKSYISQVLITWIERTFPQAEGPGGTP